MAIDLSQIQPQQLQALGRMFGINSAEDLMQAIQQNPQIAQQVLGAIGTPNADADAGWIDERAARMSHMAGTSAEPYIGEIEPLVPQYNEGQMLPPAQPIEEMQSSWPPTPPWMAQPQGDLGFPSPDDPRPAMPGWYNKSIPNPRDLGGWGRMNPERGQPIDYQPEAEADEDMTYRS